MYNNNILQLDFTHKSDYCSTGNIIVIPVECGYCHQGTVTNVTLNRSLTCQDTLSPIHIDSGAVDV